ncbi:unnamed protein product, partial [Timema podura]|nr:unnamed protein product [Timema podura]
IALLIAASCALALDFVSSSSAVLALSCIIVSVLFTCISVLSVFIVEIFPTHLRAMAVSLSLMVGRIGTVSGSLLIGTLLEINCHAMFFVIGGISLGI